MDSVTLTFGTIAGIILLIILGVTVYIGLKKSGDEKAVENFINGLTDTIFDIVLETIGDVRPEDHLTFESFRDTVINNVYAAVWDYVSYTAEEAVEVNQLTKAVFQLIDEQTVVDFTNSLLETKNLRQSIQDIYGSHKIRELIDDTEDEQLQEEYSDQTKYVENISDIELAPAEEISIPDEELSKIIPPVENEDEFIDLDDESVEIIVDRKEIIKAQDKDGNISYYEVDKDGTRRKVDKEYAISKFG